MKEPPTGSCLSAEVGGELFVRRRKKKAKRGGALLYHEKRKGGLGRASGVNRGTHSQLIAYHTIALGYRGRQCGFNTKHQSTKVANAPLAPLRRECDCLKTEIPVSVKNKETCSNSHTNRSIWSRSWGNSPSYVTKPAFDWY